MASISQQNLLSLHRFLFMYFYSSVAFKRASLCMRKFSIRGAIRIDVIFEVGLERSRCGEDALGVRFGGKTHPELIRDSQHTSSSDQAFAANSSNCLNSTLRRGWYWGSEAFRHKLLDLAAGRGNGVAQEKGSTLPRAGQQAQLGDQLRQPSVCPESLGSAGVGHGAAQETASALLRVRRRGWLAG